MLNKWFVEVKSLNMSDGNSEEIIRKDTFEEAEITYHDKCSSYLAGKQVKYAVITLVNPYGDAIMKTVANHIPDPEPTPDIEPES